MSYYWHKAWLESRTRSLVGAILLAGISIAIMRSFGRDAERFAAPDLLTASLDMPTSEVRLDGFGV